MFTLPAIDIIGASKHTGKVGTFNRYQSRVNKLPEFTGEFPVATLADEIMTEGKGQIKAMVTIGGNPVLSTPNGKKLAKAFEDLEYMIAIDIYLNESTQFANIILPSTNGLETSHYDIAFNQLSVRNTANYSAPLFEKSTDQKHDWEILNALTERMTGKENQANPEAMLDYLLKNGPYKEKNINLKTLKEHPHGIDLGALKPCLPERLFTKSQKIELAPDEFVKDLKRLSKQFSNWQSEKVSEYPFVLIGRRHLRSNNSWMHNSKLLMTGRNRCTLIMHPDDALKLQLKEKQKVSVSSSVGTVRIPVEISNEMMLGVVSMPHGFGHTYKNTNIKLSEKNAGVSINDLTDATKIDLLVGNADFSGTKVKIQVV
jgi:anaerobic selenocysteine-containing dehydrogenase